MLDRHRSSGSQCAVSLRCSLFPRVGRVWRLPQDAQRLPLGPEFGLVSVRLERVPRGLTSAGQRRGELTDPDWRMAQAMAEAVLRSGSTVYRYNRDDALPGGEGGFHLCASWLVEAYLRCGRRTEATELFQQIVDATGPTGLLPEEYDPIAERSLGNHPQAYSHLGLIRCAILMDVITVAAGVPSRSTTKPSRYDQPMHRRSRRCLTAVTIVVAVLVMTACSPPQAVGPLSDPLADPIPSGLGLTLQELVTIPQSTPNPPASPGDNLDRWARISYLGEVPDGSGRLFVPDLNGKMYLIKDGEPQTYLDVGAEFAPNFLNT